MVLWPDDATSRLIRDLWETLETAGVPSMRTHTHALHQPHVSLVVAEQLPVIAALEAVMPVPREPIRLLMEGAGIFPGGFLHLMCVANHGLLDEQRRVHEAVRSLAVDPWPHFEPGDWTPHITLGWELAEGQLVQALPIVLCHLPLEGWLDHGGVEDGTTGENWTVPDGVASESE